jgi:hypothetical protein
VGLRGRGGGETCTSTASVSNPTRLKSSTSDIIAMFKAANRGGREEESEVSRYDRS